RGRFFPDDFCLSLALSLDFIPVTSEASFGDNLLQMLECQVIYHYSVQRLYPSVIYSEYHDAVRPQAAVRKHFRQVWRRQSLWFDRCQWLRQIDLHENSWR